MSPLLAQSGHPSIARQCPLSGEWRTSRFQGVRVTSGSWDGEKVFLRNQVFEATGRRRKRRSRNRLALVVPKLWFAGNVLTIGDPRWISSGTPMIWRFTER
jgi:hypothetical protein